MRPRTPPPCLVQALAWRKVKASGTELWYNYLLNVTQVERPEELPDAMAAEVQARLAAAIHHHHHHHRHH